MDPNRSKSPLSAKDLSKQEFSQVADIPKEYQTASATVTNFKLSHLSKNAIFSYSLAFLMVMAFLFGMTSDSPDFVSLMQNFVLVMGGLLAIILGINTAKQVSSGIKFREQYGGNLNKLFVAGLALIILSFFTLGISLIPGLIMLYIGKKKIIDTNSVGIGKHTNSFLKVVYIFFGFIGGALPALIITSIGAYMLWSHWCNISSSKCL